jgi:hypothetical protein
MRTRSQAVDELCEMYLSAGTSTSLVIARLTGLLARVQQKLLHTLYPPASGITPSSLTQRYGKCSVGERVAPCRKDYPSPSSGLVRQVHLDSSVASLSEGVARVYLGFRGLSRPPGPVLDRLLLRHSPYPPQSRQNEDLRWPSLSSPRRTKRISSPRSPLCTVLLVCEDSSTVT